MNTKISITFTGDTHDGVLAAVCQYVSDANAMLARVETPEAKSEGASAPAGSAASTALPQAAPSEAASVPAARPRGRPRKEPAAPAAASAERASEVVPPTVGVTAPVAAAPEVAPVPTPPALIEPAAASPAPAAAPVVNIFDTPPAAPAAPADVLLLLTGAQRQELLTDIYAKNPQQAIALCQRFGAVRFKDLKAEQFAEFDRLGARTLAGTADPITGKGME